MELQTQVKFNWQECKVLQDSIRSARIAGFPDEQATLKLLNGIANQSAVTLLRIERAFTAFTTLRDACAEQSDPAYWEALGPALTEHRGTVGLVAPGANMPVVLAEARELQTREAQEALDLIAQARDLLHAAGERIEAE